MFSYPEARANIVKGSCVVKCYDWVIGSLQTNESQ